jgi:hypothetical protein
MASKSSKSWVVNLAMIAALIGVAFLGRQFSPLQLPKADLTGVVEPGCDLQKRSCVATLPDGGRLEFSIAPRPIPLLQALRVEVTVTGLGPRKVEVDFAGASMNMGYNRGELAITTPGSYAGQASLPVCVSGSMAWVATVIVETDGQRISVPFRFDAGH